MLVQYAFRSGVTQLLESQLIGGPSWMDSARFDVQGRLETGGPPLPAQQLQLMVQSLLEERFRLKTHHETREMPIYNLIIAKDGLKMKLSSDQTPTDGTGSTVGGLPPRGTGRMSLGPAGATMTAHAIPMANVIGFLQGQTDRIVVDKTGLKGLYDVQLRFSPEGGDFVPGGLGPPVGVGGPGNSMTGRDTPLTAGEPNPSIFTAVQKQLGLRLEPSKGRVQVIVIDSVQKPSEN